MGTNELPTITIKKQPQSTQRRQPVLIKSVKSYGRRFRSLRSQQQ
jgi:hypothetical protein